MHPMFTAALLVIVKTWKQPKCPKADEWIKMWYIYKMEYYSAIKMNEILLFATMWVDLEIIILIEVSRKDKWHMISLICGILKKSDTNELICRIGTDSQT